MDKNFKKILSCFKKSILKLSGVNLHMTESKKLLLNFFTLEERTKAFSLTLFHSFTGIENRLVFQRKQFLRELNRYTSIQDFLEQKSKILMYSMYVYNSAVSDIV